MLRPTSSPKPVAMGYPAGWLVCSTITYLYFRFAHWEKHRIVEE